MAHEIDYGKLPDAEKRARALNDLRGWAPSVDWDKAFAEIAAFAPTKENAQSVEWQFGMFLGVSGYPITAILGACWNLSDDEILELLKD